MRLGFRIQCVEKMIENIGHPIPRGAHVEGESFRLEATRSAAGLIVLLDQGDSEAFFGKMRSCRKACKSCAYDTCVGEVWHERTAQIR
ncbi:MAG: Uncharacterised protein [Flavobacteriia bacterium]|nr:MAG: Uncharacterised protein [Flavobacteriia bacterium]